MISSYEGIKAASMVIPSLGVINGKLLAVLPFIKNVDVRIKIMESLLDSAKKEKSEDEN